jgi:hypothetical protein
MNNPQKKSPRVSDGLTGLVGLLLIVFIVLKLLNYVTWSWVWILSPIWIFALAVCALTSDPIVFDAAVITFALAEAELETVAVGDIEALEEEIETLRTRVKELEATCTSYVAQQFSHLIATPIAPIPVVGEPHPEFLKLDTEES